MWSDRIRTAVSLDMKICGMLPRCLFRKDLLPQLLRALSAPQGLSYLQRAPHPRLFPSQEAQSLQWQMDASLHGPGHLGLNWDPLKGSSSSRAPCNCCWACIIVQFSFCPVLLLFPPFHRGNASQLFTTKFCHRIGFLGNLTWSEVSGDNYRASK